MPMERRGRVIRVIPTLVNRQREKPTGCDGERRLSMNGTSRVNREAQARICERLGVRFPGATRPRTDRLVHAIPKYFATFEDESALFVVRAALVRDAHYLGRSRKETGFQGSWLRIWGTTPT